MAGYNHCCFVGNLGHDLEIKYTSTGKAVVNARIAVSEKWNGEERTEWINIVLWNKVAEIAAQYLKKGSKILVAGKLQSREWDDKDGNKRRTTEILVNQMQMLSGSGGQKQEVENRQPGDDDAIPF